MRYKRPARHKRFHLNPLARIYTRRRKMRYKIPSSYNLLCSWDLSPN